MFMRLLTACTLLLSGFIIASVGFQTPFGMMVKRTIGHIPLGDKSLHFLMMTVLSFLFNASFRGRQAKIGGMSILLGSLLAGGIITLEEFSQVFIPSRNFEFLDMVCNYAGVFTGSLMIFFFPALTTSYENDRHSKTFSIQTILHRARALRHESGHGRRTLGRMG